ncbi:ferric reductase-like transmembrane domain-containing protein [Luteimonas dalianensis]|uniref:ferredoxin reductase family protein n=1 Tax=Luteimonas dalianensis TaxID=1148196 RepID=UPI003BF27252
MKKTLPNSDPGDVLKHGFLDPPGPSAPVLLLLYTILGLAPLLIAVLQGRAGGGFWWALSSGLAMIGFAMLLAQFLLSGRFRRVSGRVGIDVTMRFHQLAAWAALAFLLVHPALYALSALGDGPGAALARLSGMFSSPGLRSGVVAWWVLVLLMAMAAWRDRLPLRYEAWRLSHGVGAALIAVLGAHHTLGVGSHAADPVLAGFWLVLAAIALASLAYVYLVKPLLKRRAPWRVTGNEQVAEQMWRVTVEPVDGRGPDFHAGQFAWLNLGHSPFSLVEHPFSISSAPGDRPRVEFTIKQGGDFTDRIGEVPIGTIAWLDGPHGAFTLAGRDATRLVLIGGGVGFAPVIGILRWLRAQRWPHPVDVIYGNRVAGQILYRDELEAIADALDMRLHLVLSEPPAGWTGGTGVLDREVIQACLLARDGRLHTEALHFVCGPLPMMDAVETALSDLGVPDRNIVSERFTYS